MKQLLSLLLALVMLLTLAACETDDPTDPTDPTPKTETKWLVQSETQVYDDPMMGTSVTTYTYDALGNCLSVRQQLGDTVLNMTLEYNEKGFCTAMNMTQNDISMRYVYTLDNQGNRIKTEIFSGETLMNSQTATYDENGNLLTLETSADSYSSRYEYTYDENGNNLGYTQYMNGEVSSVITIAYDDQGRQSRMTVKNADGSIESITENTYDGNTETQVSKTSDGTVVSTQVKTFDEHGNTISIVFSGEGISSYTYTATYISIEVPISE